MEQYFISLSKKYNIEDNEELIQKIKYEISDLIENYTDILNKIGFKENDKKIITHDDIVNWIIERVNNKEIYFEYLINVDKKLINVLKHEMLLIEAKEYGDIISAKVNYPKAKRFMENYKGKISTSDALEKIDSLILEEVRNWKEDSNSISVEELVSTFKIKKYEAKQIIEKMNKQSIKEKDKESAGGLSYTITKENLLNNDAYNIYLIKEKEWDLNSPLNKLIYNYNDLKKIDEIIESRFG